MAVDRNQWVAAVADGSEEGKARKNVFAEPDYVEQALRDKYGGNVNNDTWNTPMYKVPFSDMNGSVPLYVPATESLDKVAEYNPWMERTNVGGMTDDAMGRLLAVPGANMLASLYFAGRGVQGLVADNGVKKTKNLIGDWWDALKQGDMQKANELQRQAGWSAFGDIANIAMVVGGVPVARKIASEVNKVKAQRSFNKEVDSVFDDVLKEKPQQGSVNDRRTRALEADAKAPKIIGDNGQVTNEGMKWLEKQKTWQKFQEEHPAWQDTPAKNADGKRVVKPEVQTWELKIPEGIHPQIKPLIQGAAIEKGLSKQGTISRNQLEAYIKKQGNYYQELMSDVLNTDFSGQAKIDYNAYREAVRRRLPEYSRVPRKEWEDYGLDRLGFKSGQTLQRQDFQNFLQRNPNINGFVYEDGEGIVRINPDGSGTLLRPRDLKREYGNWMNLPQLNTFTFESPGIIGDTQHYEGDPIGHSRTYMTKAEPDVLHVMESQSDWAQHRPKFDTEKAVRVEENIYLYEGQLNSWLKALRTGINPDGSTMEAWARRQIEQEFIPTIEKKIRTLKGMLASQDQMQKHMIENFTERQLQENLKYAAENGQTRMRYPTSETAAKIEGYEKTENTPEYQKALDELNRLAVQDGDLAPVPDEIDLFNNETIYYTPEKREQLIKETGKKLEDLRKAQKDRTYSSQHQTILKKYSDFPKQYQKLFGKNAEVRTVTDNKGNTWYEVDVPESYRNNKAEIVFKNGGYVNTDDKLLFDNKRKFLSNMIKSPIHAMYDAALWAGDNFGLPSNFTNVLRDIPNAMKYKLSAVPPAILKSLIDFAKGNGLTLSKSYDYYIKNPSIWQRLNTIEPLSNNNRNYNIDELKVIKDMAGNKSNITNDDIKRVSGTYGGQGSFRSYLTKPDKIVQTSIGQSNGKNGVLHDIYDFNVSSVTGQSDNNLYKKLALKNIGLNYYNLRAIMPYIGSTDIMNDDYKIHTYIDLRDINK